MEVLSDVLRTLRVRGSVYFCDCLEPPWSLEFHDRANASFHLVRRGECWVTAGEHVDRLGSGDLVYVGPGLEHVLESHNPAGPQPRQQSATLLLCGYCGFDTNHVHPLVASFPRFTIVREEELLQHVWLKGTLDQLSAEYLSQRPGADVVVDRLTEVVLVELIRLNFGRPGQSGFIRALLDKPIARALGSLHEKPQVAWTLASLGREVGMSRAALAKRFKELVGQTMFEYLTDLRMQRARVMLVDTLKPIHEVANSVGYESDLAFTKVFKKRSGVTPTRFRKLANAERDQPEESGNASGVLIG
ncbi:MAG: AraC family transcriptional regulator [Gammaproteobacteria bacterium]|nr:MAG: AraC family transcriptional regulator [Gammaproteobacteria bacterium]